MKFPETRPVVPILSHGVSIALLRAWIGAKLSKTRFTEVKAYLESVRAEALAASG